MKGLICFVALFSLALAAPKPEVPSGRVIGGADAPDGAHPYQVSVQSCLQGTLCSHMCGGTIIGPTTILTAGHCIVYPSYTYRVLLGVTRLSETTASRQLITASTTLVNPRFPGSSSLAPHDIALIILSQSIVYSNTVQPASLPFSFEEPRGNAILTGWGTTRTTMSPVDHLQFINLTIIGQQQCHDEIRAAVEENTDIPLEPNGGNVCTSGEGFVSACGGDSGGPLVLANTDTVIGVVSWGILPCGQVGAPSVFVKVSHYVDWILANSYDFNGKQQELTLGFY